jgi:acetyl-CoA carboxylase biotin carboxyl carrier protein
MRGLPMTNPEGMEMEQDVMKALLEAFEQSDWQEMTVTIGGDRLHVSRRPSSNGTAPVAEVPQADSAPDTNPSTEPPPAGTPISSPSVGLFWRAPAPGAQPFVEVGGHVAAGDTVAIVEVMKLMNHVTAPVSGTVTAVLPENGEAVEFGQLLVVVEPGE